ncbi:hypothetical protein FA95DRAFT_1600137 [Auriscalpium vulgare]|uniref:Uncharacterized protein n=1 Tax=Auriscalpium vulgare TaxID=40419 RepID=A0ACB8R3S7_9AGAM|nr:hypothetical protein FA95DRAFT_1600137 [Auriscalpium vulgare]
MANTTPFSSHTPGQESQALSQSQSLPAGNSPTTAMHLGASQPLQSQTAPAPSQYTASSNHYYVDTRYIYLLVEKKIFCVPLALLCSRVGAFAIIMDFPADDKREGSTPDYPLVVPGVTSSEFGVLADLLFGKGKIEELGDLPLVDRYVILLKLGRMWDIPSAFQYAFLRLGQPGHELPGWTPVYQLHCAIAYSIPSWIDGPFRMIVGWPYAVLTEADAVLLGASLIHRIASVKFRIQAHRLAFAYTPPRFASGVGCRTVQSCTDGWIYAWHSALALRINHPYHSMSSAAVMALLEGKGGCPGVCALCFGATMEAMRADEAFNLENFLVDQALQQLHSSIVIDEASPALDPLL